MKEEWRTIKRFDDYMVSNLGNIKSFRGRSNGLIMKPNVCGGYCYICLRNDKEVGRTSIHRVVAETFIPNPDNLPFVNHKNGNPSDNRVENLEWCTASYNTRHYFYVLKKGMLLKDQPVVQYTRYGIYVRDWDSIIQASEDTGICIDDIIHSCKRRRKHESTKGFLWRFKGDDDLKLNYKNLRGVVHINKYGEMVSKYDTIKAAAQKLGLNSSAIHKVCSKHQLQLSDGSIWRYAECFNEDELGYYHDKTFVKMRPNGIFVNKYKGVHELVDNANVSLVAIVRCLQGLQESVDGYKWCIAEEGDKSRKEKRRKAVVCLDKQMNYVCGYPTVSAAAEALNTQPIHISTACRDLSKSCRGFRWMYKEDYEKTIDKWKSINY